MDNKPKKNPLSEKIASVSPVLSDLDPETLTSDNPSTAPSKAKKPAAAKPKSETPVATEEVLLSTANGAMKNRGSASSRGTDGTDSEQAGETELELGESVVSEVAAAAKPKARRTRKAQDSAPSLNPEGDSTLEATAALSSDTEASGAATRPELNSSIDETEEAIAATAKKTGQRKARASRAKQKVEADSLDITDDSDAEQCIISEKIADSEHAYSTSTQAEISLEEEAIAAKKAEEKKKKSMATILRSIKKRRSKHPLDLDGIERIDSSIENGLTAEQVKGQFDKGYVNVTALRTNKTYFGIIMSNTFTFFNILAFIVAIAMLFTKPTLTQMFFIFIIFANILIGIYQEIRAKLSIDKLQIITAPSAVVIRDGQRKSIPLEQVVIDDITYLETGKQVPADSIVLSGECEVNESMITGESVPVKKVAGDVIFSGSFLSSGSVYARVDKVGEANYAQTLTSSAKRYQKPKSELNNSIRLIIKIATIFIIPITIAMMSIYLFTNQGTKTDDAIRSISGAVIGMIPAGMFLLTTCALATSALKLASKKTLVKDLYCIEMLARVDTLCLDKTGTITDGSMTVQRVVKFRADESVAPIETVIGSMLSATEDNNQTALALAAKFGYNTELQPKNIVPFSSQRKYSMVTFEEIGTYILGAPEYVLKDMGIRIERLINESTAAGYRVMMLAHSTQSADGDKLPTVRKAVCMIVIQDQIREDAIETIKWFKENDVAVKVISGDNPITVSEIAKRVGVENAELYISLDGLSDQEIIEASSKYTVFGRVTPEQKSLLVRSIKAKGHTVAMTGDGVNDILAMRESDCAISIASGAEAARNVSHLVLVDNNFTAMPDIVKEGRKVVNNIQKSSVLFLMKTIMSIFLALIYVIQRESYPITTDNLLLLELCVIGAPSLFLALQPNQNRIHGRFLSNVIGRALPGGLALILAVQSVEIFSLLVPSAMPEELKMSMIVICLTFTGFIVLCKNCEPMNFYRTFLVIISGLTLLFAVILAGDQFGITDFSSPVEYFNLTCILFIVSEVLLSYFVITIITKLLKRANIVFD